MLCPPKLLKENFPNDRKYTFETLVEELFLMERHIRDGSWRLCSCNPEKHLPGVAGLASEGLGFAETEDERNFMECLMSQARVFKAKIRSGEYRTQEAMNVMKDWAREARHRLVDKNWSGEWIRLETGGNSAEIMEDITKIISDLKNKPHAVAAHETDAEDFLVMEREMAEKFAVDLFESPHQKGLYSNYNHSHNEMVKKIKEVGIIYGLQQLGYAADLGLKYANTLRPEGFLGQPINFWGDILGAIGGVLGALYLKAPYDQVAAIVGGYLSTDLWNHLARLVPMQAGLVARPPPLVYTPAGTVVRPTPTPAVAAPVAPGRYQFTV